eukprot:jgi/Tetstr1/465532/TSEL_010201.t1
MRFRAVQVLYASVLALLGGGMCESEPGDAVPAAAIRDRASVSLGKGRPGGRIPTMPDTHPLLCSGGDPVHVLYTIDQEALAAVAPSIFSALANARRPGALRFHLMVPAHEDAAALCETLTRYNQTKSLGHGSLHDAPGYMCPRPAVNMMPPPKLREAPDCAEISERRDAPSCLCGGGQFHMLLLRNHSDAYKKIRAQVAMSQARATDRADLANIPNFARNWAHEMLLPLGVEKVIYLDADTIVKGDLGELWGARMKVGRAVMMARNCKKVLHRHYDFSSLLVKHFLKDPGGCMYNTGVIVMDLRMMRQLSVGSRITLLYNSHRRAKLWLQGNQQPAFVMAVANHTQVLDGRWNTCGLGYTTPHLSPVELAAARILHWTGSRKPWLKEGHFKEEWEPYSLPPAGQESR